MKKILKTIGYGFAVLFALLFSLHTTYAAGEVITQSAQNITQTSVDLYFDIGVETIEYAGVKISTAANSTTSTCSYQYSVPFDYSTTKTYFRSFSTLTAGTTYYYNACALDENGVEYVGIESSFITPNTNETNISVETVDVDPSYLTATEVKLSLIPTGVGVVRSGFKLGVGRSFSENDIVDINNIPQDCFYSINQNHQSGVIYSSDAGVVADTNYFYQACAKNSAGTEFLGEIKSFTSRLENTEEQNDSLDAAACEIDYVEFDGYNRSLSSSEPGNPQFEAFVDGQGKQIDLKIKTKNPDKCAGVGISRIGLKNQSTNAATSGNDVIVLLSAVEPTQEITFDEQGQYSIKLIAGDLPGACNYTLPEDEENICRVMVTVEYARRTATDGNPKSFWSEGPKPSSQSAFISLQGEQHAGKGSLVYRKRSGNKKWKVWSSNDPQNSGTTEPDYDSGSPCYVAIGAGNEGNGVDPSKEGYDENCYELLAPIPGIGNKTVGNRSAITDLKNYDIGDYVNTIFQAALGILMVIAVIMIVIAGVEYMTVESIYGKSDAKKRITGALLGLILALGIFIILRTINPRLLEVNFGSNIETVSIDTVLAEHSSSGIETSNGSTVPNSVRDSRSKDPRAIRPDWAMANGKIVKLSGAQGTKEVRACDESNMEQITAFGKNFYVNKYVKPSMLRVNAKWENKGGDDWYKIPKTTADENAMGSYVCRKTSSGTISYHSYGLSVDINPVNNPYGNTLVTDMPTEFVNFWKDEGWGWGGDWNNSKDAMHFSKITSEGGNQKY